LTQREVCFAAISGRLGNVVSGASKAGNIVAPHEPCDVEAQKDEQDRAAPECLKQVSVYKAFMIATAIITLVITGYYGARSCK